jgi:class 3 adenylate cyclase/TolB-like protein/Tfp pilus assembly protein PilF
VVDDRAQRRLAAILVADVMAYSRLVGEDEEGTLAALRGHRAVLDELIITHRGRIFGTAGDSVVAEFASAVDAVRAAIDIQRALAQRNQPLAPAKRLQFRIGINLGDVVVEKDDLLGDGVNIAARLQTTALPGGICISGAIYDQVHAKLALPYQYDGEQRFKNIAHPVRIYRIPVGAEPARPSRTYLSRPMKRRRMLGAALLLVVAGIAGLLAYRNIDVSASRAEDPARHNKAPLLVLPLRNMTGDTQLDGFAEGLTGEIVTAISRHPEVFVIAASTTVAARPNDQSILDLARANNVRYVLQGNIKKAGDQFRVTAQLVDGSSGEQLRPEMQDIAATDLATLRDDARRAIAAGLFGDTGALVNAEERRANRMPEPQRTAYDLNYLAFEQLSKVQKYSTEQAIELLGRAIQMEPNYGFAHANLAWAYMRMADQRWGVSYLNDLDNAYSQASKAAAIDGTDYWPQWLLGLVHRSRGDLEQSWISYEHAFEMNPDVAQLQSDASITLVCLGRYDEAVVKAELGLRMLKVPPSWMYWSAAWAEYHAHDYQKALRTLLQLTASNATPNDILLAATYAQLERDIDASNIRARRGEYAIASEEDIWKNCFRDNQEGLDHWLEGLRKAGFK